MYETKTVNEWKSEVMPAVISKKEEFHLLGYDKATAADIWSCMEMKVWKKEKDKPRRLYEVVAEIMQLNVSVYMSYLTMSVYEEDEDLMASIAAINGQS